MNIDPQAERTAVLQRLEQQRRHIDALFDKATPPSTRMASAIKSGFPRSQTMRLLISAPIFSAGLNALAIQLLGPHAKDILTALANAFHAGSKLRQERSTTRGRATQTGSAVNAPS